MQKSRSRSKTKPIIKFQFVTRSRRGFLYQSKTGFSKYLTKLIFALSPPKNGKIISINCHSRLSLCVSIVKPKSPGRKKANSFLLFGSRLCFLLAENTFFFMVSPRSQQIEFHFTIGHVRYINILTWLRGFHVKPLYLVLFSLYRSLIWELRDKGNLKNLQF